MSQIQFPPLRFDLIHGDALEELKKLKSSSIDLCMTSPPYFGKMSRYGTKKKMTEKEWSAWMYEIVFQCCRVTRGYTIVVCNGPVKNGQYFPACERLLLSCHDAGIKCERPCIWTKNSPPNRKDWLKNSWEYILAFRGLKHKSAFNWEEIALPPKFKAGGRFRQRDANGVRRLGGEYPQGKLARHSDVFFVPVGGGMLGSKLSHLCAAPYPEKLVEPFVKVLTNPGGVVLDPFGGSFTTACVALKLGRSFIGFDSDEAMCDLGLKRIKEEATPFTQTD